MATGAFSKLPTEFGRYRIERELGRGMMGAVYLAYDQRLERPVALKIPRVSEASADKLLKRFEQEARALAQVDHPQICKIFDYGRIDGKVYMALQFIEGVELKTQLPEGRPIPEQKAVQLTIELAQALSAAHEKGIVHRDLKPANVMVTHAGQLVITDFGLARRIASASTAGLTQGMILGTPGYMAPEQAMGKPNGVDHRCDIYALGVMLFEFLTGTWPFNGSPVEVIGQKCVVDPPSPRDLNPDVSPPVADICLKMIARKWEDRYASCAEVIAALTALRTGEVLPLPLPIVTTGEPPKSILRKTETRRRFRWRQPVMLLSALAGLVLFALLFLSPAEVTGRLQIELGDPSLSLRIGDRRIAQADTTNGVAVINLAAAQAHPVELFHHGQSMDVSLPPLRLPAHVQRTLYVRLEGDQLVWGGDVFPEADLPAAPSRVDVDRTPPEGSRWRGSYGGVLNGMNPTFETTSAVVVKSVPQRFVVQCTIGKSARPAMWEYTCEYRDRAWQVTSAVLQNSSWSEDDGVKTVVQSRVNCAEDAIQMAVTRNVPDGKKEETYEFRKLVSPGSFRTLPVAASKMAAPESILFSDLASGWRAYNKPDLRVRAQDVILTGNGVIRGIVSDRSDFQRCTYSLTLSGSADVEAWIGLRGCEENGRLLMVTSSIIGKPDGVHVGHSGREFDSRESGTGRTVIPPGTSFGITMNDIVKAVWITVNRKMVSGVGHTIPDSGCVGVFVKRGTLTLHEAVVDTLEPRSETTPVVTKGLPTTIVNGDFAVGWYGWQLEGGGVRFGRSAEQHQVSTYGRGGDYDTGRLRQTFVVPTNAKSLKFQLCGGNDPRLLTAALWAGPQRVYRVTAANNNDFFPVEWDLTGLRGQPVTFQLEDHSTWYWGFLTLKDLVLETDSAPAANSGKP